MGVEVGGGGEWVSEGGMGAGVGWADDDTRMRWGLDKNMI